MAESAGIQLIPETKRSIDIYVPGQNRGVILGFLFLFFISLVGGVFYYLQNSVLAQVDQVNSQLTSIENSRDKNKEAQILKVKSQIGNVSTLLNNHIMWSWVFDDVQSRINSQVTFENLSTDYIKGEFIFKGSSPDFIALSKQIAAFYQDTAITDINVTQIQTTSTGAIEFVVTLKYDRNKLISSGQQNQNQNQNQ